MRNQLLLWWAALAFSAVAFGGQSLVLTPGLQGGVVDPNLPQNQSWRVEFQIHDWNLPASNNYGARIFSLDGLGATVWLYPNGQLALGDLRDVISPAQPCFLDLGTLRNVLVRFQRDVAQKRITCELWNFDGTGYKSQTETISSSNNWTLSGGQLGSSVDSKLAFLRVFTSLIAIGSKPPTTADGGTWTELKFDGTLLDSSGQGHNGSLGGATYVATPDQMPVAFPKTFGAPSWSDWVSLRAGHPAQLQGSDSFSLADSSSAVTYFWQQLSGPSKVLWKNRSSATPTLTGLIMGTYTFLLEVTDVAGSTASTTLTLGSVATDDKGIVIPADPRVAQMFGPMIAFGKNPWGYADERAKRTVELQNPYFSAQGLNPPVWATPGQGTITYRFSGRGPSPSTSCTTLSSAILSTDTDIPVANASCLSLASLPTWVEIGNVWGSQEMVRICSTTATSGPATLSVCYDGRGMSQAGFSGPFTKNQAWPSGTIVGEFRIDGTNTSFVSDAARPLCPAGAPGPPGPVTYSAGTVALTPSSTTIVGTGSNWITSNNVIATYFVRVAATHGGGTPFVYWSSIATVTDPTHLEVDRTLPSDVDAGPFSYQIISYRYIAPEFTAPDGSKHYLLKLTQGCESETAAYVIATQDIPELNSTVMSGMRYSYKNGLGIQSAFGPNFYGSGLAARAFYLRSGWDFAKQTADIMDEYWVNDPEIGGGWAGGIPLLQGGAVVGAVADLVSNPSTQLTWDDVRRFFSRGKIGALGCNDADTRDSGYLQSWLTLGALFDTDATQRADWQAGLQSVLTRDNNCKRTDNSFANSFYWNAAGPQISMTNGSAAGTGSNIPASLCDGVATGTGWAIANSASILAITGTFSGNTIVLNGTKDGQPFTASYEYHPDNPTTTGTLAVLWPGDTGAVNWMARNSNLATLQTAMIAFGQNVNDPVLQKNYSCIWNSDTQITLDRPWEDNTGTYVAYVANLAGYGQQPYMVGIKLNSMEWATQVNDATISSGYQSLKPLVAAWSRQVGYDPNTKGQNYGTIFQFCSPSTATGVFENRTPGCNYGLNGASVRAARVLTAETSATLRSYYAGQGGSQEAIDWGDEAYGAVWGFCPFTAEGYFCDSNYVRDENSDVSLGSYKWPGFFFGMGMAHQWPAVRQGGVTPVQNQTVYLGFHLGSAASARITLTAPSGAVSTTTCGVSPCALSVDARQGDYWFQIEYLSGQGAVVAKTDPDLIHLAN